ncbi:MAG: M23 family metallopeptidase [Polyangiales bacterium]
MTPPRLALVSRAFVAMGIASLAFVSTASAQGRFRRPYGPAFRLNYDFDANYGCRLPRLCAAAVASDGHTGHDFGLALGNEIRAAQEGTVYSTFNGCPNYGYVGNPCGGRCGNYVGVRHPDGATTIYCHMQQGSLRVGGPTCRVRASFLGRSASSGSSLAHTFTFWLSPAGWQPQQAFAGSCGRSASLWVQQNGYREAPSDRCLASCPEGERRACGSSVGE